MPESVSALLVFLLIIGCVFVYVFRKKIITGVIFVAIAIIAFTFFRTSNYSVSTDIIHSQQTLSSTIAEWWNKFGSGFERAKQYYALFTQSEELRQELAEQDPGAVASALESSYEALKTIASSVESFTLPSKEQIESLSGDERKTLFSDLAAVFANTTLDSQEVPSDAIPSDATALQSGLFTDDLALDGAQGLVTHYQLESGIQAVFIKELQVPFGPEQGLYLASVQNGNEVLSDDFVFIGPLKANQGNQLYFLPELEQIEQFNTAFIYSPILQQVYAIAPLH